MDVSESRRIIQECILQESSLRDLKKADKKHAKKLADVFEEERKAKENRKLAMIAHEENNRLNIEARIKLVEARQDYLKNALNII